MKRMIIAVLILIVTNLVFAVPNKIDINFQIQPDAEGKLRGRGYPDSNYVWEGDMLVWEREITDEYGNKRVVKTYKKPIEIIANFQANSRIFGIEGNIEKIAVKKFGGALKGFVWLDNVSGGGEVILPFTAPHIFIATGDRLNPELTEIGTDTNSDNWYEIVEGKTRVVVKSFSGIGGAAGAPPELIAHYKMNDNLATTVVIDETGNHNGTAQRNTSAISVAGKINTAFDFNGTSDFIEIADHDDFTPALTPFSISKWVYMHSAPNFVIVSKGIWNVDIEWWFRTRGDLGNTLEFLLIDNNISAYIGREVNTDFTTYENQWLHLVVTYDGGTSSSGIKIYLNGQRADTDNRISGIFVAVENLPAPVYIGRYSTLYSNGLIDNVTFFSRELDQHDVDFLWNDGDGREDWAEEPFLGRLNRPLDYPLRRGRYTF